MAGFRVGRGQPPEWDGGVTYHFYMDVIAALVARYGPREIPPAFIERVLGPLGGVEYDFRALKPPPAPKQAVQELHEKIAGRILKERS